MKLADATWMEVGEFVRDSSDKICLIPTGSLEQHGPHLPVFTDSILVTAAAEAVEAELSSVVLLTPTLWLGASGHHMAFPGTLTASMTSYMDSVSACIESLIHHGFDKFFILNGHGGNTELNGIVCRQVREAKREILIGHAGYFDFADPNIFSRMKGPFKTIRHACEAETSLMLHVRPDLVRTELAVNDGLAPEPKVPGMMWMFDEMTEQGVLGAATHATQEFGQALFESCVAGMCRGFKGYSEGLALLGPE